MKKLPILLASLLFALSSAVFAQGGDNCATAQANPITIPFNQIGGTTCNGLDDYSNLPNATCIGSIYTTGPDWLYYFCATQTAPLQIQMNNMNPQYPFGSISVWQGCPNTGTCIGGTTNTPNGFTM